MGEEEEESPAEIQSAVKARLIQLSEDNDGELTPDIVIADAKKKSSPLHGEFDWNVQKAAYKYWQMRARTLIRAVRVEVNLVSTTIDAIGFLHDPSLPPHKSGYRSIKALRKDKVQAREALRAECLRAASALRRAREVATALGLENEVEVILAQVMKIVKAA